MLKVKRIIFSIVVTIITIALYIKIEQEIYRWLSIFGFMMLAIILTAIILEEKPVEFFDNFGNYKDARISSILMLVAAISLIRVITWIFI